MVCKMLLERSLRGSNGKWDLPVFVVVVVVFVFVFVFLLKKWDLGF